MPEAIIFVGLQGSGKTTYYQESSAGTHLHVSLDVQHTVERQRAALQQAFAARKPLVVDNTNATRAARAPFIAEAKAAEYRVVCCFFDLPVRTAIGRNSHRQDKKAIPVPAILRAAKQFEPPTEDEGFDEVRVIHPRELETRRK
jgi:predicted kinase